MKYTTNYNLPKAELNDAPPDISFVGEGFDKVDEALTGHDDLFVWQADRNNEFQEGINALAQQIANKTWAPFCVNSGVLDSNGAPALLSYVNDVSETTETAFQQPVLTANGTLGGNSFAVAGNQNTAWAWYMFNTSGGEWGGEVAPSTSVPTELTMYNPTPLKLASISIQNSVTLNQIWSSVIVYGSANGSGWTQIGAANNNIRTAHTWVNIAINATTAYKYIKLSFTANTTGAPIAIANVSLNAVQSVVHTGGRVIFSGSVIATTATGKTFTVANMAAVDVSNLTGREFIAFIDTAGATGVTAGRMYAQETAPTSPASGDIWFKILEPLACYQYLAGTWRERNIVPIGEVYADGAGKITGVSTYPYNQNGYTVNTRTQATPTTFGLVRTAAPEDETNCQCDDAAVTPENLYKLADYRRANTAYEIGDVVACPYHAEFMLKCTTAGTTSADALDTTNVTEGQALADGSVAWIVKGLEYSEATQTDAGLMSASDKIKLDSLGIGGGYKLPYATCSTATKTTAKVATITNDMPFSLEVGSTVIVNFSNHVVQGSNVTSGTPTLNVNSTGAKTIKLNKTGNTSGLVTLTGSEFMYKGTYKFTYDGTYWVLADHQITFSSASGN